MKIIVFFTVTCLFWKSNHCGLVKNLFGTIKEDVDKISKGDVVATINEEAKGLADDLGDILSLNKITESPKLNPTDSSQIEGNNEKHNQPTTNINVKETDKAEDTFDVTAQPDIHEVEEFVSTSDVTDGNFTKDSASSESFEITTEKISPKQVVLKTDFVAGCLGGFAYAVDGTCQEEIID